MNVWHGIGRLVSDPELRYLETTVANVKQAVPVCSFTIAINERGADGQETTDYVDCTAWDKRAESVAEHGRKGRLIGVSGKLKRRQFTTSEGKKNYRYFIRTDSVEWLDRRPDADPGAEQPRAAREDEDISDLAF